MVMAMPVVSLVEGVIKHIDLQKTIQNWFNVNFLILNLFLWVHTDHTTTTAGDIVEAADK